MSNSPAVPAPHVSWLKKFGQDIVKVLGFAAKAEPLVKEGAAIAEAAVPQFALPIAAGEGIFEKLVTWITSVEGSFAAVGQSANGAGKLQAVLAGVSGDIDSYVQANLPGTSSVLKGEAYIAAKTDVVNSVVKLLNAVEGSGTPTGATTTAVIAASAASAAVKAAGVTVAPTAAAPPGA